MPYLMPYLMPPLMSRMRLTPITLRKPAKPFGPVAAMGRVGSAPPGGGAEMLGFGFTLFGVRLTSSAGAAPLLPGLIAPPTVAGADAAGTALPGTMLTGTIGDWAAATGYDWAWLRNGTAIAGATGTGSAVAGYTVLAGDTGSTIHLQVSASNSAGTRSAFSDAVSVPAAGAGPGAFSAGFSTGFGG